VSEPTTPRDHQAVIARFVAACHADERVVAAFLGGSYARGHADAYSDLDLCLIATDDARDGLWAGRRAFIGLLGEPLFIEDFGGDLTAYFFLADGTEAELSFGRQSRFQEVHAGPYRVLVDKIGLLDGATFPWPEADQAKQTENLRHQIYWFWHDLSHFIAAMGRGQLWWGHGQLEILRRYCVNLARLREDFSAETDDYDKVDKAVPANRLSPLHATFVPMEQGPMLEAARAIVGFYRDLAPAMARTHGLSYPAELERLILARMDDLGTAAAP
jgi:predicted nucleotidyltransferase